MGDLGAVRGRIMAGQVAGLQKNVERLVGTTANGGEGQQIIRSCSRFVYENQRLDEHSFSSVLEIAKICCKYQHDRIASEPFFHLKSMYYILLLAIKRKDFHHHLVGLLSIVGPYVELCDATKGEALSMVRHLHQSIWNVSLTMAAPLDALTLQRFVFQFLLATGNAVHQVCEQAVRAHMVYESTVKSPDNIAQYYELILKSLAVALDKHKVCNEETVLAMINLIMEYAKILVKIKQCAMFSKNIKPLVRLLEKCCDQVTVMALKVGLKLPEVGMALKMGACDEKMLIRLVESCGVVAGQPGPNTIVLLGLLCTVAMFDKSSGSEVQSSLNQRISSRLVEAVIARCTTPITDDVARKVASVLYHQLSSFFDGMKSCDDPDSFLTHVLTWMDMTYPFISTHIHKITDKMGSVYNFGVHFGNFGSLAYRKGRYDMAAKFLEKAVEVLDHCHSHSPEEHKGDVFVSLNKKLRLWSDTLRYGGHYWEGAVASGRGFVRGCVSTQDLVTMWVKCKRDAEKAGSLALQGLTVCDVVSEARRKHQEVEGVIFDTVAALLLEIQCYKNQNYNTTKDQLSCGRVIVESSECVESKVKGLLVVSEALWVLASGDQATHSIKQATALLDNNRTDDTVKPILLELEALVYFWQYLCYIQIMYIKAEAEVKETKKPNSLTAQVAEPGEEEQVHDACDVRPTALLTLHTQLTSLAPLHAALNIWDKLISQGVLLEDPATTCASVASVGYIYQLSGLVTPTVKTWGLLISLARKHSLHNFFIKGVIELVLIAPELVDEELVKEVEKRLASEQGDPQDSSQACLAVTASAAIAFHYFKMGQYKQGAELVLHALQAEVMNKRTVRATEAQAVVHLVASLYAWLPPWVLEPSLSPPVPSFSYALLACRETNALLLASTSDTYNDVTCWRHRVAGLHCTTSSWLGHLSVATAQPRTARVYLETSLQLSQKLILPLRIAEFLELLAQVDLLCDQLEDLRVKVDSLQALLVTHPPPNKDLESLTPEFSKLTIVKSPKVRKKKGQQIYQDSVTGDGERMRTNSGVSDFTLKSVTNFPALVKVRPGERLGHALPSHHCSSPTMGDHEDTTIVGFLPCPSGVVTCMLCATPIIHHLRISTAVLLGLLHSHGGRFQAAEKCLNQARTMYAEAIEKAPELSKYLVSLLKRGLGEEAAAPVMFVHSRLNLVHLQTSHAWAVCLALEGKWDEALSVNLKSLQTVASQEKKLVLQDMHFVAILSLQGQALEKVVAKLTTTANTTENESQENDISQQEDEAGIIALTTPKTNRLRPSTSCKNQELINAPNHLAVMKTFDIYTDDDDDDGDDASNQRKLSNSKTPFKPATGSHCKNVSKSVSKKRQANCITKEKVNENKQLLHNIELDWNDNLPSLVLNVPSVLSASPSRNPAHCTPRQEDSAEEELLSSLNIKPKTRNKVGQKTRKPRELKAPMSEESSCTSTDSSQSTRDTDRDVHEEPAMPRGRGRPARATRVPPLSLSTSKAKSATKPKPTTRSHTTRSLRQV